MSAADRRFHVNTQLVASEVVDGEAVIINLSSGMYYTLDKVGAEVWQLVELGCSTRHMAHLLAKHHGVAPETVLSDIDELFTSLLEQELVVPSTDPTPDSPTLPSVAQPSNGYQKPALVIYTDMSEVLALDPPLPELGATPASISPEIPRQEGPEWNKG